MPSPSSNLETLRPELGGSMVEFDTEQDRQGYIAYQALPVFNVMKQSGVLGKVPIEELLKNSETLRGNGGNYSRSTLQFTDDSFATREHGHEVPIDDREAEMYSDYFDVELLSSERARSVVMRAAEKRAAAKVFNATTWGSLTTGVTNEWDDAGNATPIADVEAASQSIYGQCGMWPNAIIMSRTVFRNLRLTDDIKNHVASLGAGSSQLPANINVEHLKAAFDLKHIIIAGGTKNLANEGAAISLSEIWDDEYAMVCRVAETNDIREPCIGRTFHWSADGSLVGGTVETYRDPKSRSDIVRVRHDVDEKILYPECGHLLSNITG